eukprot:9476947-Pyramimonas_sp.AAC.1
MTVEFWMTVEDTVRAQSIVDSVSDDGRRELFRVFFQQQSALSTRNHLTVCVAGTKCVISPQSVRVLYRLVYY